MIKAKQRGFTLIELLVVIAIIGVLAAIVLVSLNTARIRARDSRRAADLASITAALELYNDRYAGYPNYAGANEATNFTSMVALLRGEGFLGSAPTDPTNVSPQVYLYLGDGAAGNGSGPITGTCSPNTVAYVMGITFERPADTTLDNNDGDCTSWGEAAGTEVSCDVAGEYCVYQVR